MGGDGVESAARRRARAAGPLKCNSGRRHRRALGQGGIDRGAQRHKTIFYRKLPVLVDLPSKVRTKVLQVR
jgi:hypothetical protein